MKEGCNPLKKAQNIGLHMSMTAYMLKWVKHILQQKLAENSKTVFTVQYNEKGKNNNQV